MSVSTDAILFFGFLLEEDGDPYPWEDEKYDGSEEWFVEVLGVEFPDQDWDSLTKTEQEQVWDEYRQVKRKALKSSEIELIQHCSGSHPMYAIGIKKTTKTAWRGYPAHIDPNLAVQVGWIEDLKKFSRVLNLEPEIYDPEKHKKDITGKLGWWLVSYWGQ